LSFEERLKKYKEKLLKQKVEIEELFEKEAGFIRKK